MILIYHFIVTDNTDNTDKMTHNSQTVNYYYGCTNKENVSTTSSITSTNDNLKENVSKQKNLSRNLISASSCDCMDHKALGIGSGKGPGYVRYVIDTSTTEIITISIIGHYTSSSGFSYGTTEVKTVDGFTVDNDISPYLPRMTPKLCIEKEMIPLYFEKASDYVWTMKESFLEELKNKGKLVLIFNGYYASNLVKIVVRDLN